MRIIPASLLVFCFISDAQGAFILDDFDDPAEVVSPEMEGDLIETLNVGDQNAARTLAIFDVFTNPFAKLDSSTTRPSHLTAERSESSSSDGLGLARLSATYRFNESPVDFTEHGENKAVILDVASVTGPTPPPFIYLLVEDRGLFFEALINVDVRVSRSLSIPFDSFRPRGGGLGTTEFNAVEFLFVGINGNGTVNGILEQGWTVEIDRIRVGRIPEPSSLVLWSIASSVFFGLQASILRRRDRIDDHQN
ncbi:MAG: hypothetical protein RID07_15350 [Lacipirellulaceae bacterium]